MSERRRRPLPWLALLALLVPAARGHADATTPDLRIMDADAVPYLDAGGRADYRRFLDSDLPRAFALSPDGHHALAAQRGDAARTEAEALAHCHAAGGAGCALYAVGLDIVWPGVAWRAPTPPPAAATADGASLRPDPWYLWHGGKAGLLVWAAPADDGWPPPFVRLFNNAGLSIVRPEGGLTPALLAAAHAGGRRVVLAGDDASAWAALAAAGLVGAADAVIVVSPASPAGAAPGAFAGLVAALPAGIRLGYVQFDGDDTIADDEATARAQAVAGLRHRIAALVALDRPDGFAGHDAGLGVPFARYFGACLVRLALAAAPPSGC